MALAKRARLVREESAAAWIENVVKYAPSLVDEAGIDDIERIAAAVWSRP